METSDNAPAASELAEKGRAAATVGRMAKAVGASEVQCDGASGVVPRAWLLRAHVEAEERGRVRAATMATRRSRGDSDGVGHAGPPPRRRTVCRNWAASIVGQWQHKAVAAQQPIQRRCEARLGAVRTWGGRGTGTLATCFSSLLCCTVVVSTTRRHSQGRGAPTVVSKPTR
jgi:hypothetical protein